MPTGANNTNLGPAPLQTPIIGERGMCAVTFGTWLSKIANLLNWQILGTPSTNVGNVITPRMFQCTQANLGNLGLGPGDVGALCWVTDYGHLLQWTGSGWQWGPGEQGSGMLQAFAVAPTASGWHVCDGSTGIKYLKGDGTTGTADLPNITGGAGAYMLLGSSYVKTITGAQSPTSSTPTFTGTPGTTGNDSGGQAIVQGTGTPITVAQHTHTHSFTPAGTVSAPTISLPGDPIANFEALLYFRQ